MKINTMKGAIFVAACLLGMSALALAAEVRYCRYTSRTCVVDATQHISDHATPIQTFPPFQAQHVK